MPAAMIDAKVVGLASSQVQWKVSTGVAPTEVGMDVTIDGLETLLATGGPNQTHSLKILKDDGNTDEFSGIFVTGEGAAENPNIKRVILKDRRWLWKFKIITKRYNMRRRVGSRRRGQWQEALQQQPVFALQFAAFSTKDGEGEKPWTAIEVLKDLLTNPDGLNENSANIIVDADVKSLEQLPIEDLVIDDSGDAALAVALAKIPGAAITINPDGKIRIFNSLSGKERAITGLGFIGFPGTAGPEIIGGGHVEFDLREFERPSAVDVYFTMEVELRQDFLGDDPSAVGTVTASNPPRFAENVLPIPDFELTLKDGTKVFQGTYVTFKQYLDALESEAVVGNLTKLTFEIINKAMIPGTSFWAVLDLLGKVSVFGEDANWSARIAAIKTHYRQTFRINRQWMDRLLSIKDYLVATIDITSGQRAPAMAFADHAIKPTKKGLLKQALNGGGLFFAWNVDGYPGKDKEITATTKPAPARVQIVDSDQGILRIAYQVDPYLLSDTVFPSKIDNMPANNFRKSNSAVPFGWDMRSRNGKIPQWSAEQRAAILFTAVPGAPNSKRQLYRIRVLPNEIKSLLPQAAQSSLALAKGPIKEVRVGAGIETARVRWQQKKATVIQKIFGVGGMLENPRVDLADLVINDDLQASIGDRAASLPAIARAVAASIYAQETARIIGGMTVRMIGKQQLEGQMRELVHGVDTSGAQLTAINLNPGFAPLDMFTYLGDNTRQIILKNVQP